MSLINILLIIHVIVVIVMVGTILMQRSASDGFISNQSPGSMFSGRGKVSFMSNLTKTLGAIFICMSLLLAWLSTGGHGEFKKNSVLDSLEGQKIETPAKPLENAPAAPASDAAPVAPAAPKVPLAE